MPGEEFKDKGIELNNILNPDVEIHCRESKCRQVLVNLLNNSLDAINNFRKNGLKFQQEIWHNRDRFV